jgi:hypothetical protein
VIFKSREELAALPEAERLRYSARYIWVAVALGILLGLQFAFVESYRVIGIVIVAGALLCVPIAVVATRRARSAEIRARDGA